MAKNQGVQAMPEHPEYMNRSQLFRGVALCKLGLTNTMRLLMAT